MKFWREKIMLLCGGTSHASRQFLNNLFVESNSVNKLNQFQIGFKFTALRKSTSHQCLLVLVLLQANFAQIPPPRFQIPIIYCICYS